MKIFRWIRSLFCSHAIYYDTDMHRRADKQIEARCYKCGKLLVADCGIHLGAKLYLRNKL